MHGFCNSEEQRRLSAARSRGELPLWLGQNLPCCFLLLFFIVVGALLYPIVVMEVHCLVQYAVINTARTTWCIVLEGEMSINIYEIILTIFCMHGIMGKIRADVILTYRL
jgi:hypothetical protein